MTGQVYLVYEGIIIDCIPLKLFEYFAHNSRWYSLSQVYNIPDMDETEYVCTTWNDWKNILKGVLCNAIP